MNSRWAAAARALRRLLSLLAALLFVGVVAASVAVYIALSGNNLSLLRSLTARVGRLMAGQHTDRLTLDVRVMPRDGRIAGTATLTVRSLEENRQRFYFLLNDALRVRDVHVGSTAPPRRPSTYQLSLLTIVDVGSPVPKGTTIDLTFDYDGAPGAGRFSVGTGTVNPQHVLLNVDEFWFPTDVQSFFNADVTLTLPAGMTVVHNGAHATSVGRGDLQQVHWTTDRPVPGLALVAGPYTLVSKEIDGTTYRVYLANDVQLDATRIIKTMDEATRTFNERYGPSGFPQLTLFVSREFRRGFNDGAGLIGLSIRHFRTGDYGFALIAHEIAHAWWGDTVAEKWLSPGTGGEWIVEGLAEFSSLIATEATYGGDALTRRLVTEFFDPDRQSVIAEMSVLDNTFAEAQARDTIYRKGAYVAMMLRRTLGDEATFRGLRQFAERYKYQQVTDSELQTVMEEASGQHLDRFFADWVRSTHLADLSLDGNSQGELTVNNLGAAALPAEIDLWSFKKNGGDAVRRTVHVGDKVPQDGETDYSVLDPLLTWADMRRENNRFPRRTPPVYVASSPKGDMLVTAGEPFPWARTTISSTSAGHAQHTWDFERGVMQAPAWAADGTHAVISYAAAKTPLPDVIVLAADGTRHTLGQGSAPSGASDGSVYAAQDDRLVRFAANGSVSTFLQRCSERLDGPLPSPDGTHVVYSAARGNHLELHVVQADGHGDQVVLATDHDRLVYRWSVDGTRLYTIMGGNWDWQLWEIPLGIEPPRPLAKDAAAIADLALSPDGTQLAFAAAPALDYPVNRRQLYVLNLHDQTARAIPLPDTDVTSVSWGDADSLFVVATAASPGQPAVFPAQRTLKRVRLSDGNIEDVQ